MSLPFKPTPLLIATLCIGLSGCAEFPELEVSEAEFDSETPYPEFVPLEVLLKEPEATITDETQEDLDARREDLLNTPLTQPSDSDDALQKRIDALRKRQQELSTPSAPAVTNTNTDQSIEDRLRDRLENGIKPPTASE